MTIETPRPTDDDVEYCESCGRPTNHDVHVEIRQDGDPEDGDPGTIREPYRVATCRSCGTERSRRMDDG